MPESDAFDFIIVGAGSADCGPEADCPVFVRARLKAVATRLRLDMPTAFLKTGSGYQLTRMPPVPP